MLWKQCGMSATASTTIKNNLQAAASTALEIESNRIWTWNPLLGDFYLIPHFQWRVEFLLTAASTALEIAVRSVRSQHRQQSRTSQQQRSQHRYGNHVQAVRSEHRRQFPPHCQTAGVQSSSQEWEGIQQPHKTLENRILTCPPTTKEARS